MFTDKLY